LGFYLFFYYFFILTQKKKTNKMNFRVCIEMTNKQKSDITLSSQCRNDLGLVLKRMGDFEQARSFLEDSVKINPNNAAATLNLGNVFVKVDNLFVCLCLCLFVSFRSCYIYLFMSVSFCLCSFIYLFVFFVFCFFFFL